MEQNPFAVIRKLEADLERVKRSVLTQPAATTANGSVLTSDTTQTGGVKWQQTVRGILVPNATVGTDKTQPSFPSGTWSQMYGADLYKVGDYFTGATLVNSSGSQYVQIDHAGHYIFTVQFTGTIPSSTWVGYGITSKADSDAGRINRDAHNHDVPFNATTDYKVRTFQRYCAVGDLIAPIMVFSGATGNVVHFNQTTTRAHFSFVRVAA